MKTFEQNMETELVLTSWAKWLQDGLGLVVAIRVGRGGKYSHDALNLRRAG